MNKSDHRFDCRRVIHVLEGRRSIAGNGMRMELAEIVLNIGGRAVHRRALAQVIHIAGRNGPALDIVLGVANAFVVAIPDIALKVPPNAGTSAPRLNA